MLERSESAGGWPRQKYAEFYASSGDHREGYRLRCSGRRPLSSMTRRSEKPQVTLPCPQSTPRVLQGPAASVPGGCVPYPAPSQPWPAAPPHSGAPAASQLSDADILLLTGKQRTFSRLLVPTTRKSTDAQREGWLLPMSWPSRTSFHPPRHTHLFAGNFPTPKRHSIKLRHEKARLAGNQPQGPHWQEQAPSLASPSLPLWRGSRGASALGLALPLKSSLYADLVRPTRLPTCPAFIHELLMEVSKTNLLTVLNSGSTSPSFIHLCLQICSMESRLLGSSTSMWRIKCSHSARQQPGQGIRMSPEATCKGVPASPKGSSFAL